MDQSPMCAAVYCLIIMRLITKMYHDPPTHPPSLCARLCVDTQFKHTHAHINQKCCSRWLLSKCEIVADIALSCWVRASAVKQPIYTPFYVPLESKLLRKNAYTFIIAITENYILLILQSGFFFFSAWLGAAAATVQRLQQGSPV